MAPEFSIILLTVFAGAGQGLFLFIFAADLLGAIRGAPLAPDTVTLAAVMALALMTAGLVASVFHLSHPLRGVKAARRYKSSWLSREALALPPAMGLIALYGAAAWLDYSVDARLAIGAVAAAASLYLYLATGMIYASVPYIKEWNTAYTPLSFTLIGLAVGGMGAVAALEISGGGALTMVRGVIPILLAAALVKWWHWRRNARLFTPFTPHAAIGVMRPDARLMDMGTTYQHYNTTEYDARAPAATVETMRYIVIGALFIGPLALLSLDYMPLLRGEGGWLGAPALVLALTGAVAERWLFFVEGNHAQNLYYGTYRGRKGPNPLLESGKAHAPLPPR